MSTVSVIGLDLAKNIFQLHGVDATGRVVLRKSLRRDHVARFFANLPACVVGMESCATSAYWARLIESCGHTVRRIHSRFVKPYLMNNKNDANDAAAICEAIQRPRMRFVPHKSQEQADIQAVHRVRAGLVQARTATINQIRGLLAECGVVIRQGPRNVRVQLPVILGESNDDLSGAMRSILASLLDTLVHLDEQVLKQEKVLQKIAKESEVCGRLMQMPGVDPLTATILLTVAGRASDLKKRAGVRRITWPDAAPTLIRRQAAPGGHHQTGQQLCADALDPWRSGGAADDVPRVRNPWNRGQGQMAGEPGRSTRRQPDKCRAGQQNGSYRVAHNRPRRRVLDGGVIATRKFCIRSRQKGS